MTQENHADVPIAHDERTLHPQRRRRNLCPIDVLTLAIILIAGLIGVLVGHLSVADTATLVAALTGAYVTVRNG